MDTLFIYQSIPDLVPIVIWEGKQFEDCSERNATNYRDDVDSWACPEDCSWPDDEDSPQGCLKRPGFEDGIPVWKTFVFHFWGDSQTPLGPQWTLAPWDDGVENHYLGI